MLSVVIYLFLPDLHLAAAMCNFKDLQFNSGLLKGSTLGFVGFAASLPKTRWSKSSFMVTCSIISQICTQVRWKPAFFIDFDRHKSNKNMPVLEWTKNNYIILFVLLAHTSKGTTASRIWLLWSYSENLQHCNF